MKTKTFLSELTPPRHTGLFAKFFALFFCLAMGMNVLGADPTFDAPATKSYAGQTFLDVAGTPKNATDVSSNNYLTYGGYYVAKVLGVTTWYNSSDDSPASNLNATTGPSVENQDQKGFFASQTTAGGKTDGNMGYGSLKCHSSRQRYFYVTGTNSVAIISNDNQASKYVLLIVEEVASDGTLTKVGTDASAATKGTTYSIIEHASSLNPTKYYKVTVSSNNSSNCNFAQIRFGKAAATTYTVTFNANGGSCGTSSLTEASAGAGVTLPSATPATGYDFLGWATADDATEAEYEAGKTYKPTANITLYAVYEVHVTKYAVNFAAGDGTGTMDALEYAEGAEVTLPACTFTAPEGKEFDIWTSSDVTITDGKFTMPANAVTVTATWKDLPVIDYLVRIEVTGQTTYVVTGTVAGSTGGVKSLGGTPENGGYKLNTSGAYVQVTLGSGYFEPGDKVIAYCTKTGGKMSVLSGATDADFIGGNTANWVVGENEYVLPESLGENINSIYIARTSTYGQNPYIQWVKVVRPAKHDVIFAAGDGTGSMDTKQVAEGANYTIPACTFTAPAGKEFDVWTSSDVTITDGKFTMPANNVTLTATWKTSVTKYTVTYKDGETTLGTEEVAEGEKAASVPTPTKELNTFAGWEDGEHNPVDFATATISADLTVYAKWTPMGEATLIDIEQFVIDNGKSGDIKAELTAHNFDYNLTLGDSKDGLDDVQAGKDYENVAYRGLKLKTNGSYIVGNIPANTRVNVVIGTLGTAKVQVNGVDAAALAGGSGDADKSVKENYHNANNYYDFVEAGVLKVLCTGTSTTVLKGIILGEIPAQSDDASLATLTLNGETIEGFTSTKPNYTITLPYGTTENPVVAATATDENATVSTPIQVSGTLAGNDLQYDWYVTAEDGTIKYYRINFTVAPKLGAEIIKATITGNSTATASGLYAGSVATLNSSKKLGNNGDYVKFVLKTDETFATGDVLAFDVTAANGGTKIYITSDAPAKANASSATILSTLDYTFVEGMNYIVMPEAINGLSEFYLYRVDSKFNPTINSVAVLRQMPSMIKSFTIGEAEGVIDQENKTIAVSVPFGTDVTALTPAIEAYANGGATVTPTTAQDFTSAKTYTVTSAYSEDDAVSYVVTVTVAEPACPTEVTISGDKTYTDGATIELTAATDGTGAVTYQWYKDEVAIDGATTATFSKTATMTDGGNYVCKVNQGTCEEVASEAYAVVVNKNDVTAVVVEAVTVARVKMGETIQLRATITPADATYPDITWTANDYMSLSDANPTTVTPIKPGKDKSVYATADGRKSSAFKVTVYSEVTYNTNGGDAIANAEYDGSTSITLPTPTGGTEPFLGWYSDAEFTQFVGAAGKTGYKPADNVTLYAKWTLPDAETPVFSQNIADHEYEFGTTVFEALTVVASPVTSYQWYKNGAVIEGETSATYTPTTVGTYKVVAINAPVGYNPTSTNSEEAVISVAAPAGGYTQVDVTGDMIWDFSKVPVDASAVTSDGIKSTEANQVMANIANVQTDRDVFFSEALVMGNNNEHAYRATNNECYQGRLLKFHTTVDGFVTIDARAASGSTTLRIGDKDFGSIGTTRKNYSAFVPAGDVEIIAGNNDPSKQTVRIFSMTFTAVTAANEVRTGLEAGRMYTYCPAQDAKVVGNAEFYVPENFDGFYVNLLQVNELTAGHGYIMIPTAANVYALFNGTALTEAVPASADTYGMQGCLSGDLNGEGKMPIETSDDNIIVKNNHLYTAYNNYLTAGKAYIRLDIVRELTAEPENPAPRRRIGFETNTPTNLEAVKAAEGVQKLMVDGVLYIVREGKVYNAAGLLVK